MWYWSIGLHHLVQGCPNLVLEGRCPAEFSSNLPQHTCREVSSVPSESLISWFRCVWLGLDLNFAGHRPSRTEFGHPWSSFTLDSLARFLNKSAILNILFEWIILWSRSHVVFPKCIATGSVLQKIMHVALYAPFKLKLRLSHNPLTQALVNVVNVVIVVVPSLWFCFLLWNNNCVKQVYHAHTKKMDGAKTLLFFEGHPGIFGCTNQLTKFAWLALYTDPHIHIKMKYTLAFSW